MPNTRPLADIRRDAIRALRAIVNASDDTDLTRRRREAARALVEARAHFITKDGDVDWSGRTGAYHAFSGEVFAEAGVPRELAPTIQSAVRYHAGNIVREFVAQDDLASAGFTSSGSPRERAAARRKDLKATVGLLEAGGPLEGDEASRALLTVSNVLQRIPLGAIEALPPKRRAEARDTLRQLAERATALVG